MSQLATGQAAEVGTSRLPGSGRRIVTGADDWRTKQAAELTMSVVGAQRGAGAALGGQGGRRSGAGRARVEHRRHVVGLPPELKAGRAGHFDVGKDPVPSGFSRLDFDADFDATT